MKKLCILFFIPWAILSQNSSISDKQNLEQLGVDDYTLLFTENDVSYFQFWFSKDKKPAVLALHSLEDYNDPLFLFVENKEWNEYAKKNYAHPDTYVNFVHPDQVEKIQLKIVEHPLFADYVKDSPNHLNIYHYPRGIFFKNNIMTGELEKRQKPMLLTGLEKKYSESAGEFAWRLKPLVRISDYQGTTINEVLAAGRELTEDIGYKAQIALDKVREEERIRKEAEAERLRIATLRKKGFVYFPKPYFSKIGVYRDGVDETERTMYMEIFHGDFNAVWEALQEKDRSKNLAELFFEGSSIKRFIELYSSFAINYTAECQETLGLDYDILQLSSTFKTSTLSGQEISSNTRDMGTLHIDKRFSQKFQSYYSTYADSFGSTVRTEMKNFIKTHGCDCKAVDQLAENLLRFTRLEPSLQAAQIPPKGKDCDHIK